MLNGSAQPTPAGEVCNEKDVVEIQKTWETKNMANSADPEHGNKGSVPKMEITESRESLKECATRNEQGAIIRSPGYKWLDKKREACKSQRITCQSGIAKSRILMNRIASGRVVCKSGLYVELALPHRFVERDEKEKKVCGIDSPYGYRPPWHLAPCFRTSWLSTRRLEMRHWLLLSVIEGGKI